MDGSETKLCSNCKREIPLVNYTIHTVHCARNIKVCPVCKEPVPLADIEEHHEKYHKLLPCKQCGDSVCGTDLEDHIRDSCANTIKSCRFCELELPRRDIPAHEGYCGVRTEQCPECREWVMIKYRQLHLDSNHGFIRLDDDPKPVPKKEPLKVPIVPVTARIINTPLLATVASGSNSADLHQPRPHTFIRYPTQNSPGNNRASPSTSAVVPTDGEVSNSWRAQSNGIRPPLKRTNDQPQINTNVAAVNKVNKDIRIGHGAVKKRPAPQPPADPKREAALHSAIGRRLKEDRDRQEQNAIRAAAGLPPVLSPAEKIEKLRKMDALQNREVADTDDYKNRLQGRVWQKPQYDLGEVLGSSGDPSNNPRNRYSPNKGSPRKELENASNVNEQVKLGESGPKNINLMPRNPLRNINLQNNLDFGNGSALGAASKRFNDAQNAGSSRVVGFAPGSQSDSGFRSFGIPQQNSSDSKSANKPQIIGSSSSSNVPRVTRVGDDAPSLEDEDWEREADYRNLKPMTHEEFMERFKELRLGRRDRRQDTDRFNEIKTSLSALRRGLNEVTAPYNSANNGPVNRSPNNSPSSDDDNDNVQLPCEFCGMAVPADDLVQHQTGCRPDLARYKPEAAPRPRSASPLDNAAPALIPCEFCAETLPLDLITAHQERCGREANLLYPD